jgi:hypothetical protein
MKCYNFNQLGHPPYRCPKKVSASEERKLAYAQEERESKKAVDFPLDSE